VDFTNPVGIVTRALLDAGHRAIGLCNVAIGFQRRFAGLLDVAPERVTLDHIGLNHLTWERAAYVDGVDMLPRLLSEQVDQLAAEVRLPGSLLLSQGAVPSYYLRYFYAHDEVVREERGHPTRGQQVHEIEASLLALYADPDVRDKPDLLMRRGGAYYSEAAIGLVASLLGNAPGAHAANVRNAGTLPFLDDGAVIEVTCDVAGGAAVPRPAGTVAPAFAGLIAHVSAYEQLALDAALHGGRDRVYQALLAHPLIGQHELADGLTDRLLAANLAWTR
jgi:6-phospho-beta-glucosidase